MRKIVLAVVAVLFLVYTFGFSTGAATAEGIITYREAHFVWGKGIAFVFDASGYRNRDVKDATLTIGSTLFKVHCSVNKKEGKIVCVAGSGLTQYAGMTGILTVAGQAFYVTIPARPAQPLGGTGSLTCPEGSELGANVVFRTGGGDITSPIFFSGSTLAEVRTSAESWVDGSDIVGIESIGSLFCELELGT
jgi:hypothetical protein